MKRDPSKKPVERRKHSRKKRVTPTPSAQANPEVCRNCAKDLKGSERALYVEEEIGRIFCSETCISTFFTPEIERLEKEYYRKIVPGDLSAEEREGYAHLRWMTLQEPDELWREKTLSGDHRYTLISEFEPGAKKVWSICICLFLRGEPSFLYLAFTTRNTAMANHYRRGERVNWEAMKAQFAEVKAAEAAQEVAEAEAEARKTDRLAEAWTEEETYRAQLSHERMEDDIPESEYNLYQSCVEETLEKPDEVWSMRLSETDTRKLYHFVRHYPDEKPGMWYIIAAKEVDENNEEIEIIDAFPTRDRGLVDRYRHGEQEIGGQTNDEGKGASRVIH